MLTDLLVINTALSKITPKNDSNPGYCTPVCSLVRGRRQYKWQSASSSGSALVNVDAPHISNYTLAMRTVRVPVSSDV
jgi:hypothetical protein